MATTERPRLVEIEIGETRLPSLERMLTALPVDDGLAYLVTRSGAADGKVDDPDGFATVPFQSVTDGQAVMAGQIYIAPPGHRARVENGRFKLHPVNKEIAPGTPDPGDPAAAPGAEVAATVLAQVNQQLDRDNSDLRNLLESTDIATLFLDDANRVQLFTPAATALFDIDDAALGRSLTDVAARLDYPELGDDLDQVRQTDQPVERVVRIEETDETFSTRLRPYQTLDDRFDGIVATFVDITDRKRAEARLEDSTLQLTRQFAEMEALYDSVPLGLAMLDTDFRYQRVNETLARINGIAVEDHLGRTMDEVLPKIAPHAMPMMQKALDGTPTLGVPMTTDTPASPGIRRHWNVDYYPVRTDDEVLGLGLVVREVTQERALARAAREAEARMRGLFDRAPANIGVFEGPEHVIIYSNPSNTQIMDSGPLIGRRVGDVQPELADQGIIALLDRVYASGEPVELDELAVDLGPGAGDRHYFRQSLHPWFDADGRVAGVMAFNLDISDEVAARQAAEAARNHLESVLDGLASFVGLLDPDGTLTVANRPALDAAGLAPEDVLGRKFWDCFWWSHDSQVQARLKDAVARAADGETVRYDEWIRIAGKALICIDFRLVPQFDDAGRVVELVPSGLDITERARAQERQTMLMGELEHRVKNVLATVQSVMRFTARNSATKQDLVDSLQDRLAAIARTHDGLIRRDWAGHSLRDIVDEEFAPYCERPGDRYTLDGPDLLLPPATAMTLGLAIHELTTNAAKYGALSTATGHVAIAVTQKDGTIRTLNWRETGGPRIDTPPARRGFGSFLVQDVLSAELGARVDIAFNAEGMHLHLQVDD